MRRLLVIFAVVGALLGVPVSDAAAQTAPFCAPGQTPQFQAGFAALKARLGPTMGEPIECEHANSDNGDTLQETTTGLAFYRRATNTPTFTDGFRHWALTSAGLVYWEGSSIDPPVAAAPPSPPSPPAAPTTDLRGFVNSVAGQVDTYWRERLARNNTPYSSPRAVMWITNGRAQTACGSGRASGPFYCSLDRSLGFPAQFFEPLWPDADAAVAVVIAHEWGHHVQNLLGLLRGQFFTIQTELQADCLAGNFFGYAGTQGWLDDGDVDEAARMSYIGGDSSDWRDPRAHGSPQQRVDAFMRGYDSQTSCEVFTQQRR